MYHNKKVNKQNRYSEFGKLVVRWRERDILFLEFGDRKSMQRSHLQWSSEMPQNPTGEQQGSPLLGLHSATCPSYARLGNPHLPSLLILIPAIFRGMHHYR